MTTTPKMSVVVYGPQGCGKTRNAQKIMRALGLSKVIEADELHGRPFPRYRTLLLTNQRPAASYRYPIMSFDEAMAKVTP